MSESDLLRRAAKVARETAQADRPLPWRVASDPQFPGPSGTSVKNKSHHVTGYARPSVTAHIALWHPDVAYAVAGWLDHRAGAIECQHQCRANDVASGVDTTTDEQWRNSLHRHYRHEIAVACALLNEDPNHE